MAKQWPSYVNMCSYDPPEVIRRRHAEHLAYRDATDADCELVDLEPAPAWDRSGIKSHYRLNVYTYRGWKVYMLHTGCFAVIPEFEGDDR